MLNKIFCLIQKEIMNYRGNTYFIYLLEYEYLRFYQKISTVTIMLTAYVMSALDTLAPTGTIIPHTDNKGKSWLSLLHES